MRVWVFYSVSKKTILLLVVEQRLTGGAKSQGKAGDRLARIVSVVPQSIGGCGEDD